MAEKGSEIAKNSHIVLDRDDWYTNFPIYTKSSDQVLFSVSGSRQVGRWFGYVFSLGISATGGNRLSEMSVKVEGDGAEAILQEFIKEYERNQNNISPGMIKNTIKRNNWYVKDYSDNASLLECSSGFRVHIIIQRKAPI